MTRNRLNYRALPCAIGLLLVVTDTLYAADRDPGAKDYSEALNLVSTEITKTVARQNVLLVWLLDDSSSMKDDHHAMQQLLPGFYTTLARAAAERDSDSAVISSVVSFGDKATILVDKPARDVAGISDVFRKVRIGESGKENLCRAVGQTVAKYAPHARKAKRQLFIIAVTDETASDTEVLEEALQLCRRQQARVFVLGRPAVLGSGRSFVVWRSPLSKQTFHIPLEQGVSAAGPELLNWDGIGPLMTVVPDAFGPYPLARLASETNGMMIQLTATGFGRSTDYEASEYAPGLQSRREWEQLVAKSRFRSTIREVVVALNPLLDRKLNLRRSGYSTNLTEFRKESLREFEKAQYAVTLLQRAITEFDNVEPLREQEGSRRWQANYDLTRAQCQAFRVRLFNTIFALDQHGSLPESKDAAPDRMLNLELTSKINEPPDEQLRKLQKALRIDGTTTEFAAELKQQRDVATALLKTVQKNHPRTPWSRAASLELKRGFGVRLKEVPRSPKVKQRIKVPVL